MLRHVAAARVVGPVRGSLAHVNVASSMMFGGVTGVAVADTAAVGSTLIPAMIRDGYPRGFAAAITAASSVMGAIIPPSVAMLIIAFIYGGGLSVSRLFLSGATPGLLIGFDMMAYVALIARRRGFVGSDERRTVATVLRYFWPALPGLGLPVLVLGGIIGGVFTPTEAGAVAVAYCLLLGLVLYRNIGLRDIGESLLVSAKTSAVVFILLATAKLIAWLLVINLVPQSIGTWLQSFIASREPFLLTIVLIFVLLGCIMEGVATMIILVPVVAPMGALFGVEPHHLALIIVMTVPIALFIVCPIAQCSVREVSFEVIPFILVILSASLDNVAVKISGLGMFDRSWTVESIRPFVLGAIEAFGTRRAMFGSNFPVDGMFSPYRRLWEAYDEITQDLSRDERRRLFAENAIATYRLNPVAAAAGAQ